MTTHTIIERPYPGLRPFSREESYLFFGREEHTDQLLEKLGESRFISVVGLSGCGKSSLVRAGMIAALESGYLVSAGAHWRIVEMRPGNDPLRNLAEALTKTLQPLHPGCPQDTGSVAPGNSKHPVSPSVRQPGFSGMFPFWQASLRRGPRGLLEILRENPLPPNTNLLLMVDQFEELFR